MEAKVQYNDLVGTAAADISDSSKMGHEIFDDLLKDNGIDTELYQNV